MSTLLNRISCGALSAACTLAIAVGLASGVTTASAADDIKVSYADLQLQRPADVKILYQRLARAAESVCAEVPTQELARHEAYRRCYQSALDSAVQQVRSPELLAYERARNGKQS
jgi:UrcA family protein